MVLVLHCLRAGLIEYIFYTFMCLNCTYSTIFCSLFYFSFLHFYSFAIIIFVFFCFEWENLHLCVCVCVHRFWLRNCIDLIIIEFYARIFHCSSHAIKSHGICLNLCELCSFRPLVILRKLYTLKYQLKSIKRYTLCECMSAYAMS